MQQNIYNGQQTCHSFLRIFLKLLQIYLTRWTPPRDGRNNILISEINILKLLKIKKYNS